ncbi:amino acid adenylation domain-containing protein [Nitrospirillum sp. BR 11828]|uniref:amino acid adenylation domain-containing protein n=1 Tax=Nitrospirillum sp. BR 11828 TaxID=3104325 RepID=UPI002ACA1A87|nr:amino acid adenylation domain-containing protein [Nitrospirillum sp. BR 11828]MDZ5645863.1 amino acid adenylation domain-containing protein [Nitrospirillum sp. BR 11828]
MTRAQVAAAVEALVARQEILRTRFLPAAADGAEPTMTLLPPGPITLERLDVADDEGTDAAMRGWVRPFDLYGPPPVRFALLAVAGQPRHLLLDVHHALADAFSVEVLLAELGVLLRGRDLPPVPARQLKDYAWWSRRGAGALVDGEAAAYWRQRFATMPPLLDLPADRARPAQPSRRPGNLEFTLSPTVMAAMRAAAAARRTTPFALVTAAWSVLLARYAQVNDLVIAVPIDSRAQDGLAGMVGMMVSLLPLRLSVMAGDRVADLLDRAQATCTEALRHRAYGLGRLLTDLAVPAQPGRTPLADITLSYMNFKALGDDVAVESFGLTRTEAKADLAIFVRDLPDSVLVACEYAADLFDPDRMDRLADHFQTLLAGLAAAGPDTMVASLPLMPPAEAIRIAGWERGAMPALDLDLGLFGAFARQAMSNPAKVALRGPDGDLTYGALLRRASGVAARLTAAGVRPGDRVALHVERDAAAVALVLGIVGAGAVYMPLDPTYPPDRVAWLLEDGGCVVAVADAAGRAVLSDRLPVLAAEEMRDAEADAVPTPPTDGLAYLLYTSGSTGRPKGVLVSQRAVLRLAQGDDHADIRPDDRVTQTGSLAFDASTYEIWVTLIRGATLCLVTREQLLDPVQLSGALRHHQATVVWMTTGLFNRQADADPSCFQGVRAVITGGEAASPAHLRRVLEAAPNLVLLNGYGPTENTTFSTMHRVTAADLEQGAGPVPIGRPIAHTRVAVLDPEGRPVPTGVWGEIAVGGLGLADGYNGRPDLTAERFRADPEDPAQMLYWTGDLGRWRADGVLEFGGRRDSQVKIRGYRIELEEIEQALATCPGVARAVVLHRPQPGDLVAFHQDVAGAGWRPEDLRAWLAERLPAYMVPSRFVAVADVPVTINGKVDRARLLADLGADLDAAVEPPLPGIERLVADILADLFNRPVEDRRLGFVALGGHSLLAIRVVNRIAEATGVRLTMRDFFAADTVADLAALAGRGTGTEAPIPRAADAPDYPASNAQARLYLAHRLDSDSGAYNITFALPAADLDPDALNGALDRLVRDHEPLRTLLFEVDGAIRQRIEPEALSAVAVVDLRETDDPTAEALRWARREAATPFDLTRVPLARACALRLDERGWLVLLVMHHVVGDGWSTRILLRELAAHYRDVLAGVAFAAPERAITYRDFAVWQAGRDWRAAAHYWRRTLDGAPGAIALPTDRPPPAVQSHRGDTVARVLPPAVAQGLTDYARQRGVTLATVGLALFSSLLYRLARQADLVVGMGVAGRDRAALEGLIGFFVNVLPIRLSFDDETEFDGLVDQTHAALMAALEYRDYPFDLLVRAVAPKRSGNRQPLVNVVFEYQHFQDLGADLAVEDGPALGTARADAEGRDGAGALDPAFMQEVEAAIRPATAKHDLLLFLTDRPGQMEFLLEYDTDVIDRPTAERWLAYLGQFATMIVNRPGKEAAE